MTSLGLNVVAADGPNSSNLKSEIMPVLLWDKPVTAGTKLIFGPLEASQFIAENWAQCTDLHRALADSCIRMALDGRASPDEARELFEAAL